MMRGAAIFGGNWDNGDWAGSRYANVSNWPDNSNEWIGARGRSDDQMVRFDFSALCRRQPHRLNTSVFLDGFLWPRPTGFGPGHSPGR